MNNPFGIPDDVFLNLLESTAKQAAAASQTARSATQAQEQLFEKGAKSAKQIYDSYIKVGFTEAQAFELLKCVLTKNNR